MHLKIGHLYDDLTIGGVSYWSIYGLGGPGPGGQNFWFRPDDTSFRRGKQFWNFRQVMHYVRPGAVRIAADCSEPALRSLAFSHNGRITAILINTRPPAATRSVTIRGLPPGNYGVCRCVNSRSYEDLGLKTVAADGRLTVQVPGNTVLTIYPHPGGNLPPVVVNWEARPTFLKRPTSRITLSAAARDPELDQLSLLWKVTRQPQGAATRIANPHSGTTGAEGLTVAGQYVFTVTAQWVYLWSRESDSPDNHRIEASQHPVMNVNRPWVRVEGLHMLFGQHVVCEITADHCGVVRCEIFNGGLGVGSKGAVRELVVRGCHIYDEVNGIVISGERSSGPGAGKTDRGHYLIWHNRISDCRRGVWISSGKTHQDRIWNNLIERCGAGFSMRNVVAIPDAPHLADNVFRENEVAVYMVADRDATEKISTFVQGGFRSHNNLFCRNKVDWQSPLTWGRNLDLSLPAVQTFKDLKLERDSLAAEANLDRFGRSQDDCPAIEKGAAVPLPDYVRRPDAWDIGLGPWTSQQRRPEPGLTLSIAGSPASVDPGEEVKLHAVLANEFSGQAVNLGGERDSI